MASHMRSNDLFPVFMLDTVLSFPMLAYKDHANSRTLATSLLSLSRCRLPMMSASCGTPSRCKRSKAVSIALHQIELISPLVFTCWVQVKGDGVLAAPKPRRRALATNQSAVSLQLCIIIYRDLFDMFHMAAA